MNKLEELIQDDILENCDVLTRQHVPHYEWKEEQYYKALLLLIKERMEDELV